MARTLHHCDCCGKQRRDVVSMGRDANGDPDAPDVCFICRVENERGRQYDSKLGRYVPHGYADYMAALAEDSSD